MFWGCVFLFFGGDFFFERGGGITVLNIFVIIRYFFRPAGSENCIVIAVLCMENVIVNEFRWGFFNAARIRKLNDVRQVSLDRV